MAWVDSRYVCPGCGRGVYPLAQPTARNVLDVTRLWHWECERVAMRDALAADEAARREGGAR